MSDTFAGSAVRLAGAAGVLLGWRPADFWNATPAELEAVLAALTPPGATPPDAQALARLKEMHPDG